MPQKISIIAGLFLIIIGQFALGVETNGDSDIQVLTTAAEGGDAEYRAQIGKNLRLKRALFGVLPMLQKSCCILQGQRCSFNIVEKF